MTFGAWWEEYTKDSIVSFEVFRPPFHKCWRDAQAAIEAYDSVLPAKNERLEIAIKQLAAKKALLHHEIRDLRAENKKVELEYTKLQRHNKSLTAAVNRMAEALAVALNTLGDKYDLASTEVEEGA